MKRRILSLLPLALVLAALLCAPAFALTEAEVEAQVSASSKEAVTGNVLIWFLCAVAFLKVSQKIDSFMASMGVNVGRTGGSLMAEAMIAARGVSMIAKAGGHVMGGFGRSGGGSASGSGQASPGSAGSTGGFFKGGLIGMAGRYITNSAVKTATTQTAAVHTAQKQTATAATHTADTVRTSGNTDSTTRTDSAVTTGGTDSTIHSAEFTGSDIQSDTSVFAEAVSQQEGVIITGQETQTAVHTDGTRTANSVEHTHTQGSGEGIPTPGASGQPSRSSTHITHQTSIGGAVFARSLASGGKFANDVIGTVARGDIRSTGSITGDLASQALLSYTGITALGGPAAEAPVYKEVEIGGGRITGTEATPEHPEGIAFGMYHAGQYAKPDGEFQPVHTADGQLWYKQYAVDTVVKTPFKAPDGEVDYHKDIAKKLPDPPKRKDRM